MSNTLNKQFRSTFEKWKVDHGHTYRSLEALIGCSRGLLHGIVKGKRNASSSIVLDILRVTGIDMTLDEIYRD